MNLDNFINTTLSPQLFWESINILITKPHVVNKRLWGCKSWFKKKFKPICPWKLPQILNRLEDSITNDNIEQHSINILNQLNMIVQDEVKSDDVDGIVEIQLVELLPKNYNDNAAYQVICLQRDKCRVSFFNVSPMNPEVNICPNFSYSIYLDQNDNKIMLTATKVEDSKSYLWILNKVLPQLIKWGSESVSYKSKTNLVSESLSLVSQTKYYEKYNDLKLKYGKELVKIWPECTDASKFVYEDIAIAAYLLLLWEADNNEKKTFVDLGCGNGLLVYLLSKEGHKGLGVDVRKRNIWNMFPADVILEERTITPSDTTEFSEMDWIIGNHSDELTPWVPVIAAKSSYKSSFFLLPCCAYNFDGSKYQRKNSHKSQYNDYLEHIKQLCIDCGYEVETDRLKIPSTKRICFIGRNRRYSADEYSKYHDIIDKLINSGMKTSQDNSQETDFKAREPLERVRNCTQIEKTVIDSIVECISKYLLEGCDLEKKWSIGKTVEIHELVKLIPKEQLNILKSECGGLQTLLKNNHNIFLIQNGKVTLRYPKTIKEVESTPKKKRNKQVIIHVQQKPCWFYNKHPQGCPLADSECSYLHVKYR